MKYRCTMCGEIYDEAKAGVLWVDLPEGWTCPICGAPKSLFEPVEGSDDGAATEPDAVNDAKVATGEPAVADPLDAFSYIQALAETGEIPLGSAGAKSELSPFAEVLMVAGQLASKPLADTMAVKTEVVLGSSAKKPLILKAPILVSHMSYGALTGEVKEAIATGAKAAGVAVESGEGGIYEKERAAAEAFVFEYVPNKYSVTDGNLKNVDAIDIKIGQAAKPGLGGHLPGAKVTAEIAAMRGFPEGEDIISPPAFPEINSAEDLRDLVTELRERSGGRPIGIKIAANDIEGDLGWIKVAEPDYITIDGRGGGTGAAPSLWKETAGVPTLYALVRARKFMDENEMSQELIVTGGLRTAADVAKCLCLGADAVALATGVLTAVAAPTSAEISKAEKVQNYLSATIDELKMYARACGLSDLADFGLKNLVTTSDTVCNHTPIRHVGL